MNNSRSNPKQCPIERMPPPRTLKEFLKDDEYSTSCSSSGFKSLPRRLPHSDHHPHHPPPPKLQRSRSRSRAAAEAAVSSFQKLLKSLHLIKSSPPPPSTLPRSLSKRLFNWSSSSSLSKKKNKPPKCHRRSSSEGKIKVKDILRWRSFRDVTAPEEAKSPESATITTTTSGASKGSKSWGGESEISFTADELPCWWGHGDYYLLEGEKEEGESEKCNNNHVDVDVDVGDGDGDGDGDLMRETMEATDLDALGTGPGPQLEDIITIEEDKEQHSPVSVLNSPFRDETSDEELASSFDRFANIERTKQSLLERIQWLENLAGGDDQSSLDDEDTETDQVEEQQQQQLEVQRKEENAVFEKAKSRVYLTRELGRLRAGQGLKNTEVWIKEMEREWQWSKFGEEREEIGVELEVCVLQDLVDEVLVDLFG